MRRAQAIVHASPAIGAAFTQYTVEFAAGGTLPAGDVQRFLYVLEGPVALDGRTLDAGDFAYLPPGSGSIAAPQAARMIVVEKPYEPLEGTDAPHAFIGHEYDCTPTPLHDDPGLEARYLIPDDPAFDFRMLTLTYQPGTMLPMVEVHVMEHGLLMLAGGGIYRLGERFHPVETGDFLYLAPYCPQWFGALGRTPARYILYKNWARSPR
jgi:(S)-ureidoglycine aminohydrolase